MPARRKQQVPKVELYAKPTGPEDWLGYIEDAGGKWVLFFKGNGDASFRVIGGATLTTWNGYRRGGRNATR